MSKQKKSFHTFPRDVRADRRRQVFKMLDNNYTKQEVANFTEVQLSIIYDWIKTRKDLEKNNYYGLKRGNPVIVDNLKVHHAKIIQKRPKKIMSYFKHENLTYIYLEELIALLIIKSKI